MAKPLPLSPLPQRRRSPKNPQHPAWNLAEISASGGMSGIAEMVSRAMAEGPIPTPQLVTAIAADSPAPGGTPEAIVRDGAKLDRSNFKATNFDPSNLMTNHAIENKGDNLSDPSNLERSNLDPLN